MLVVRGNEKAHILAGVTPISEGQPLDNADIRVNNHGNIARVGECGGSESTSISRLHELGIKIGVVRNGRYYRRVEGRDGWPCLVVE